MHNIFENLGYISQYYCFSWIFDQMDIALVSRKSKNISDPKLLNGSVFII